MYNTEQRQLLKDIAKSSIQHGLDHGQALKVDLDALPTILSEQRASFVTLEKNQHLRGCIGMLQACKPLAQDVADNSYAAAFSDHRFPPLISTELDAITIHISILSPTEPIACHTETELKQQLRPNIDGLILDDGFHKATFLPSVWESLSNTTDFIDQLKIKAGLPTDYWSHNLKAYRYTTESF